MNKPRIWLKCKWRGKYLIRCALRSSLPSHALWICGKHRSVYFSCLVLFFLCVCVDSVPKLLYQKPGLCFMPFVVLDKGKKWKSWWDVSHVWREKTWAPKQKIPLTFSPSVSILLSQKMHTLEPSCTILRKSDWRSAWFASGLQSLGVKVHSLILYDRPERNHAEPLA